MREAVTYGPTPWYLHGRILATEARQMSWRPAGDADPSAMAMVLFAAPDTPMFALAGYAYARLLGGGRLLVWRPEPRPRGEHPASEVFQLFDLQALGSITDLRAESQE